MNKAQAKHHDSMPRKYRGTYRRAVEIGARGRQSAIRSKCLACMSWQEAEVTGCTITHCPLWPYRTGSTPQVAGD